MKSIALISICTFALGTAKSDDVYPNGCPKDWSEEQLFPTNDCHKFYQCWDGELVVHTCPSKLFFSIEENRCEWAEKVDCTDRQIPDDNNNGDIENEGNDNGGGGTCNCNPGEAPEICAADDSEGVLVAHENCNQFYICNGGKPVAQSCPANLLFNPYTSQCDWAENVECGDRVIPDEDCEDNGDGGNDNGNGDSGSGGGTCNCNPGEAPAICAADDSDGVLIAHENCNQFYICNGGKPVAQRCPANLLFNPYTNKCDWADNVECGDRLIPDGDCEDNGDGGNDNGNGDSCNCDNCNCDNGNTEDCNCNNCNCGNDNGNGDNGNGDSGNGDSGNGGGTCNCNPGEAPEICAADDSDGVLVAHENCNQFYICNGGRPVAQSCPANLLFNPYTNKCDWADNVECGDRLIPDGDCEDNGDVGNDNGNGDSCNCDNCNCDNGNTENCNCNNCNCGNDNGNGDNGNGDSGNGDSGNGGGTCNCNPEEAPEICAADDSDGVLVAHENCNQFYICNGGRPVAQSCPATLLFNPYTNKCDWADNVECGDRLIPDGDCEDNGDGGNDNGNGDSCNCDNCNCDNGNTEDCNCNNCNCGNDNGNGDNGNGDSGNGDSGNGGGTCNCNPGEAPEICAADDSNGVLVAHENCNQFYICNGGRPVAQSCPANLLFNPYTNKCDWAHNVECGDRLIPDGDCEDNGDGGSDNGNGDSCNCDNCNCDNGNTENCNCNNCNCGNDNGNGDNGNGDSGNGDSGNGGGTCNCNPGEAPEICAADDSDGVLVAHENCNQFYICNGGRPVAQSCPANLLFNPYTNKCDWADNVECGDRLIPDGDCEDNGNGGNDNGNGDSCNCDNCNCDNGNTEDCNCNNCNCGNDNGNGDSGNGDSGNGGGTCNCNPGEAPEICAADDSDGVLVAHENCNQFYICNRGKPVAQSCPANLLFNPYTNKCDWADNVECGDRVIPDVDCEDNGDGGNDNGNDDSGNGDSGSGGGTCNCNPGEAPAICAADDSDGVLVAHENCNQFYVCNGGKPVAQICPANLLFNPYTNKCDWADNVECGDRVIPDEDCEDNGDGGNDNGNGDSGSGGGTCNCNPGEAPAICAADDSDGVLIAHENCNQFYVCNGGKPVAQSCPANLMFNPYTNKCDWAENVKCGDRITDEENNVDQDSGSDNELSCIESNGGAGNDDPRQAASICASENSHGVLVAHENCNQFYICDNKSPVTVSCPATLLFNPYNDKCDWSHCVRCGNRVYDKNAAIYSSLNKHIPARLARKVL